MTDIFRIVSKPISSDVARDIHSIKLQASDLYEYISLALPEGREKSLAITKLEECVMWATKGITG